MAVGKVTLKEGNKRKILIDLTKDTAVEDKVLKGYTFHKANGEIVNGTIETYSGTTEINENGTLATSGKYLENDITINVDGSSSASKIAPTSISFGGSTSDTLDLSCLDTSNVTYMANMFYGCSNLINLNLSNFDTSNVTNMSDMFGKCHQLSILDLSSFDTSNVTEMSSMFFNCSSLQTLKLPVKFNECNSDLGLVGLSNLSQILVPTPALSYYTDSTAEEHCPYFADNKELRNKIVGYDAPTTTYTFVTDGGTPVKPITTNGFLQNQVSTPTTEGYILRGWYFDSEFTKKVKFPYLNLNDSKTNITLYAKYNAPEPVSKEFAVNINAMSNPAEAQTYIITSDYEATGLGSQGHWKSVWFKYTPTINCNISLINTEKDLNWQVIKADDNSLVAENDPETAQVSLTANTQYYIAIAIWNGELGSFTTGFNIQGEKKYDKERNKKF